MFRFRFKCPSETNGFFMLFASFWVSLYLSHSLSAVDYTPAIDSNMGTCWQQIFCRFWLLLNRWTLMATVTAVTCYFRFFCLLHIVVLTRLRLLPLPTHCSCLPLLIESCPPLRMFSFFISPDHGSNSITRLEI